MLEEPEPVLTVQQDPVSCSLNNPVSCFQGKVGSFLKPHLIQKCFYGPSLFRVLPKMSHQWSEVCVVLFALLGDFCGFLELVFFLIVLINPAANMAEQSFFVSPVHQL